MFVLLCLCALAGSFVPHTKLSPPKLRGPQTNCNHTPSLCPHVWPPKSNPISRGPISIGPFGRGALAGRDKSRQRFAGELNSLGVAGLTRTLRAATICWASQMGARSSRTCPSGPKVAPWWPISGRNGRAKANKSVPLWLLDCRRLSLINLQPRGRAHKAACFKLVSAQRQIHAHKQCKLCACHCATASAQHARQPQLVRPFSRPLF